MNRIVVRYHEVALKKTNRRMFVSQLTRNILAALEGTGVTRTHRAPGRIILHLEDEDRWPEARARLQHVFGIANFLLCEPSSVDLSELSANIVDRVAQCQFDTFAVRTRRCDKTYPTRSPEVSAYIGAEIVQHTGRRVDLKNPDLEIHVEILPRETLYSLEKVEGSRGLPLDVDGRAIALLSGGIDSPVAAHRILARGCSLEYLHFHGAPYQGRSSLEKARELACLLSRWQTDTVLHAVPFGDIQREIVKSVPRRPRIVLYRRMMVRVAAVLARRRQCGALVTGDSLGQVASQTLASIIAIDDACDMPILRPLIGMDKDEITAQGRALGSYEISIQPEEDCCQLFVPKHPCTAIALEAARGAEAALDIDALVERALDGIESVRPTPADADPIRRDVARG